MEAEPAWVASVSLEALLYVHLLSVPISLLEFMGELVRGAFAHCDRLNDA